MMYNSIFHKSILLVSLLWIALFGVACASGSSGSGGSAGSTSAQPRVVPTMPSAKFTAVSAQQGSAITATVSSEVAATATTAVDLSRGTTVYTNRCAACHGPQGQGVADKGGALQGKIASLSEFDTLLRTGGQGRLGPTHLFGPSAISGSGLEALYAYVQTLAQ